MGARVGPDAAGSHPCRAQACRRRLVGDRARPAVGNGTGAVNQTEPGAPSDGSLRVTGRLIHDGSPVTVTARGGLIVEVAPSAAPAPNLPWLAPGFHDLQINGYAGRDFNAGSWGLASPVEHDFAGLQRELARHGTALFCPTIVTDAPKRMGANLRRIADALDQDPLLRRAVTGIHLEGPFLSPEDGPRGAHPAEHVRHPDPELFDGLQDAARGHIRICTLAPELPGALDLIERLVAQGVVAAVGHTGGSPQDIRNAVAAGATLSTHLGNGCHAAIPRHNSYLWEQLACDRLMATLIVDGLHIEPAEARAFVRAKGPGHTALISDAVMLGGMPPGAYADGRFEVMADGRIVLAGTPYLAGASALLDTCVANALRWTDMDLPQVVACVTEAPARALISEPGASSGGSVGMVHKGRIEVGFDADMTLFRTTEVGPI
ncbi:MAG: amidohydrolase family protein, partial [Armatimonadetes bacterium]|nr:amidohydrolase family protein [Armatimonadota bacterium]